MTTTAVRGFPLVILIILLTMGSVPPGAGPQTRVDARSAEAFTLTPWTSIGPDGGDMLVLARGRANPNLLLASAGSYPTTIYRSTDEGATWTRAASVSASGASFAVAPSNPAVMYAADWGNVYRSTNGGAGWSSRPAPGGCTISVMAVHPANPSTVFALGAWWGAGVNALEFFKSVNGGDTWTRSHVRSEDSSYYPSAYAVVVAPSNPAVIYVAGYVEAEHRVWRSSDGGATWSFTPKFGEPTTIALAVSPVDPMKVFAGTYWSIRRSSDGGATWTKNSGTAFGQALAVDPLNPSVIYGGYNKETYKSVDGGVTWARSVGMHGSSCRAMSAYGGHVLYAGNAGVFRSLDGGASWLESNAGLRAANIAAIAVAPGAPNVLYAEMAGGGFYKSVDFGSTWARCPDFQQCETIARIVVHPTDANEVYILSGG